MSTRWSRSEAAVADGLDAHLAEFLATLAKAGYSEGTWRDKQRAVVPFIRWVREARIAVADLDEASVGRSWPARPVGDGSGAVRRAHVVAELQGHQ
jgi:hypothetical protein